MKQTLKSLTLMQITVMCLSITPACLAAPFFEIGQCYLFLPGHDHISKGKVVNITPHEIVFDDIVILHETMNLEGETETIRIMQKADTIKRYIDSQNRTKHETGYPLTGTPISYSRSEMAAIKLDRCGK